MNPTDRSNPTTSNKDPVVYDLDSSLNTIEIIPHRSISAALRPPKFTVDDDISRGFVPPRSEWTRTDCPPTWRTPDPSDATKPGKTVEELPFDEALQWLCRYRPGPDMDTANQYLQSLETRLSADPTMDTGGPDSVGNIIKRSLREKIGETETAESKASAAADETGKSS